MYVILLGAPGAGKGTQAVNVAEGLKVPHVATGDLFRQALSQGTKLGEKAKGYMENGMLVPDEITIQMVLERLSGSDCKKGAVLDGFPRNLEQARALDKALQERGKVVDKVVYMKVSEAELIKRLAGRWICRKCQTPYHTVDSPPKVKGKCDRCGGELYQRADDTPETVKKRLVVYFKETTPLIEYYTKASKLNEVEAEGNIAGVSEKILSAIGKGKH